jgi:hypothetical protein
MGYNRARSALARESAVHHLDAESYWRARTELEHKKKGGNFAAL